MARILYSWELGGGLGHLSVIHPVLKSLQQAGHQVGGIVCDPTHADQFLGSLKIRYARLSPTRASKNQLIEPLSTFAHVLHNSVLANRQACLKNCQAIVSLIRDFRPDIVICDHAPATLMATRGTDIPTIVWGTGFTCPPPDIPLPDWRPGRSNDPGKLAADEQATLQLLNKTLHELERPECRQMTDIYSQATATLLTTFVELDHFPHRKNGVCVGTWETIAGGRPCWPETSGSKVFAYLKPTDKLPIALAALEKIEVSAIVFSPGHQAKFADLVVPANVSLIDQPVDMQQVALECDVALLNGTHTTVMQMLRAGKPVVSLPLLLEQQLTSERISDLRAGECLLHPTAEQLSVALQRAVAPNAFPGVFEFAREYGGVSNELALANVVGRIEAILAS
jgi:UDP:flavonoid glycosyltransferase YjiC (YdhE family)